MRKISSDQVGIAQGEIVLFSDFKDDGPMWRGSGTREIVREITFDEPFDEAPSVFVSLAMWDWDFGRNARGDLSAREITKTGFQIAFQTWEDTRIARLRAAWTAIGPVRDEDVWDID